MVICGEENPKENKNATEADTLSISRRCEMKLKLPHDIKVHIAKKLFPRILLFTTLIIATVFVERVFHSTLVAHYAGAGGLYYVIIIPNIMLLSGVPKEFIDKSWRGEIVGVYVKKHLDNTQYIPASCESMRDRYSIHLKLKLDDGNIKTVEACHDYEKFDENLKGVRYTYKVGMRVLHVYGTKCIQILPNDDSEWINCVICADNNPIERDKCQSCGHTLHII